MKVILLLLLFFQVQVFSQSSPKLGDTILEYQVILVKENKTNTIIGVSKNLPGDPWYDYARIFLTIEKKDLNFSFIEGKIAAIEVAILNLKLISLNEDIYPVYGYTIQGVVKNNSMKITMLNPRREYGEIKKNERINGWYVGIIHGLKIDFPNGDWEIPPSFKGVGDDGYLYEILKISNILQIRRIE